MYVYRDVSRAKVCVGYVCVYTFVVVVVYSSPDSLYFSASDSIPASDINIINSRHARSLSHFGEKSCARGGLGSERRTAGVAWVQFVKFAGIKREMGGKMYFEEAGALSSF